MTSSIESATAADLEAMADLLAELFALENDFQSERDKQLRGLRLILGNPQIERLFVLRLDDEIAGMANALITITHRRSARALSFPANYQKTDTEDRSIHHPARHFSIVLCRNMHK